MKLKITFLLTALILVISVNAQEKETSFNINKDLLFHNTSITKKGLIVSWANRESFSLNFYDLDLKLKLHTSRKVKWLSRKSGFFVTPNGNQVIFINNITTGDSEILQISLEGTYKSHFINKEKWKSISPGNLKAVFVTNKSINYISTLNGKATHPKKKIDEKLILYKVNLDNHKSQKINLAFPTIKTDPTKTSFWSYEAHNNEAIYFASINRRKLENGVELTVNIIKKDYENNTLKDVKINFKRKNISKLMSVKPYNAFAKNENAYLGQTDMYFEDAEYPRSKCAVKIDSKNEYIYLYGRVKLSRDAINHDGRNLFVKKYDFNGKLIWEQNFKRLYTLTGKVDYEKSFYTLPENMKLLKFYINEDQSVRLKTNNSYWDFSSEGKLLLTEKIEKSPRNIYFTANKSKGKVFYGINNVSDETEALVEFNNKTRDVNVLLFKK